MIAWCYALPYMDAAIAPKAQTLLLAIDGIVPLVIEAPRAKGQDAYGLGHMAIWQRDTFTYEGLCVKLSLDEQSRLDVKNLSPEQLCDHIAVVEANPVSYTHLTLPTKRIV